jgi:hypothetical protein
MTIPSIVALVLFFASIAVTVLLVAACIVAGDADASNDARSHIGERLGGGRGVDHHGQEQ